MDQVLQWIIDNKEWLFSGCGLMILGVLGRLLFKRFGSSSSQSIKTGAHSKNIQVGGNINFGPQNRDR